MQVYKNGIPEPAVYDSGTGFVTLSSPVTELDKIYITWYEESNEPSAGAFAAAAGFMYNFTPELLFDVSFTGLYPFIQKGEYASSTNSKQSFSALTAGLTYQKGFLFCSFVHASSYGRRIRHFAKRSGGRYGSFDVCCSGQNN